MAEATTTIQVGNVDLLDIHTPTSPINGNGASLLSTLNTSTENLLKANPELSRRKTSRRFAITGPTITVCLRDPFSSSSSSASASSRPRSFLHGNYEDRSVDPYQSKESKVFITSWEERLGRTWKHIQMLPISIGQWISNPNVDRGQSTGRVEGWVPQSLRSTLSSLSPTILFSIRSLLPPLPNILPSLRSMSLSMGYHYQPLEPTFHDPLQKLSSHSPPSSTSFLPSFSSISSTISSPWLTRQKCPSPFSMEGYVRFYNTFFTGHRHDGKQHIFHGLVPFGKKKTNYNYYNKKEEIHIQDATGPSGSNDRQGIGVTFELVPAYQFHTQEASLAVKIGFGQQHHQEQQQYLYPQDSSTSILDGTRVEKENFFTSPRSITTDSYMNSSFMVLARLVSSNPFQINRARNHLYSDTNIPKQYQTSQSSSSYGSKKLPLLRSLRASYQVNHLPSFTSLSSLSIQPMYDFVQNSQSCIMTAKSSSGRTAALLDLNWDDPTFAIIHALDEYNTISPEISLSSSSIIYNWNVMLGHNGDRGSIKTRVDPLSSIQITWTDNSSYDENHIGNGKWITDIKLPLTSTDRIGRDGKCLPWKADVRVRRTFVF